MINTGREMTSLMESLGRARIPVEPDYLVLLEREIHERQETRFSPVHAWNDRCSADHRRLFARIEADVAGLADWINSRFKAAVYEDPHSPLCVIASNNGDMDEIHARLDAYCANQPELTVARNDVYARFSHRAYNKGTALAEITRLLGLSSDLVFAAGDHLNDLPMLTPSYARFIAAPANSVSSVQDQVRSLGGYVSRLPHGLGVEEALTSFLNRSVRDV